MIRIKSVRGYTNASPRSGVFRQIRVHEVEDTSRVEIQNLSAKSRFYKRR